MARTCLKSSFYLVSVFYTVGAICLTVGAVLYALKVKEVTDLRNPVQYQLRTNATWLQLFPFVFVPIGVLVFIVNCCGAFGAGSNNKGILNLYNVFTALIIVLFIAAAVLSVVVVSKESEPFIKESIDSAFEEAMNKRNIKEKFALFEKSLSCCGSSGPKDYRSRTPDSPLPKTCCPEGTDCTMISNQLKGCVIVAQAYNQWVAVVTTVVCGFLVFLSIISVILSTALSKNLDSKKISDVQ